MTVTGITPSGDVLSGGRVVPRSAASSIGEPSRAPTSPTGKPAPWLSLTRRSGNYGAFWIALASMVVMQMNKWIPADASKGWLFATLVAWTIFTAVLWIATFRHSKALVWVFSTLLLLFILLDVAVKTGNPTLTHIAGWEGIFCALTAWYLMSAVILNEAYGRVVLPVGPLQTQPTKA